MIDQGRLARLDAVIRRAQAAGDVALAAKALDLLTRVIRQNAEEAIRAGADPQVPDAMTRAHAREEDQPDGLHKLRRGRDRCSATRRDGQPCQAPAVEGSWVCRRHGGAAPQVQIKARHTLLLQAAYDTSRTFEEARGTPGEFGALCKALAAQRELDAYEGKLQRLSELRAEAKRRRPGRGSVSTARPSPEGGTKP